MNQEIPYRGRNRSCTVPGKEPMKIMVVDDDETILTLVEIMLLRDGHEVVCMGDDMHAVRALEEDEDLQVDLLVTDLLMPEHDGWSVIRAARQRFPSLPAILMTGSGTAGVEKQVEAFGGCGYLKKPFRIARFRELVRDLSAMRSRKRMV